MKRFLCLLAFGLSASACASIPAAPTPVFESFVPAGFAVTKEERLFGATTLTRWERRGEAPLVAHILRLDLSEPGIRLATTPGDPSRGSEFVAQLTSVQLENAGAQFAVNASYFLPFKGGSRGGDDYYPHVGDPVGASGAVIAGGRHVSPVEPDLDVRVNAIVCMTDSHVLIVTGQVCARDVQDGVAAGPLLLKEGVLQDFSQHDAAYAAAAAPRTALGLSPDRRTAWIVVVDGRLAGYSLGASLPKLAALFSALGASDAINLDGGGSSTLVRQGSDGRAEIVNRPVHTNIPGRERPVANHLLIFVGDEIAERAHHR